MMQDNHKATTPPSAATPNNVDMPQHIKNLRDPHTSLKPEK